MKNKKIISWALYDWANSSFSTTIMAGFFPVFFKEYWSTGVDSTLTTARLGTAISVGSLIIALLSPTLGALADQRGYKKIFCFIFMLMGLFACANLSFIPQGDWLWAICAYTVAMMGFNASSVFYDALLPSVANDEQRDYASSLGYSLGYLGGGVLFTINILMFLKPELFAIPDQATAVKISFFTVALWWGFFSIPLFKNVPEPEAPRSQDNLLIATHKSVLQLWETLQKLLHEKNTLLFLAAFWLYIDGVYTVMTMAVDFGISLGFKSSDLISALLIVQFIGFPFALLFSKLADRWGCRVPILICICIYAITVIGATQMQNSTHFYILAAIFGMAQGGVQALSRSMYSRMVPPQASGEYFGLFNLVGKFASIIGPSLVGWGAYLTGDARKGMLGLLILFIVGGSLLFLVKETHRPKIS